jgi:hypothetical protein
VTEPASLSDRLQAAHDRVIDEPLPEWLEEASCGPHVKHLAHLAMHAAETGATIEEWEEWIRVRVAEASPKLLAEAEECMRAAGLWPWQGPVPRGGPADDEPGRPSSPPNAVAERGGDPACWAHRVCPDCGRLNDAEHPSVCQACGAAFPRD